MRSFEQIQLARKSLILGVTAILTCISLGLASQEAPRKIGFIVAVGSYPPETFWKPINSVNDIPIIMQALLQQGFSEENIVVLKDHEATRKGILRAFDLVEQMITSGSIVVIHFSGHGQQIKDDNGDELDGYDEAFIPYDAQKYYQTNGYHGENHLRDDEIGVILTQLREKAGAKGNILVTIDACHSGTGTRGISNSRGTLDRFENKEKSPPLQRDETGGFLEILDSSGMAPVVIISASGPNELNFEHSTSDGGSCGSLTWAFSKSLLKASSNLTYRGLFHQISLEMATIVPNQHPQMEGTPDQKLFGGDIVQQAPYFTIDHAIDKRTLQVNCGKLFGICDSSELMFYASGTINPSLSEPICLGYVSDATMFSCKVHLNDSILIEKALNLWGFLKFQHPGSYISHVNVDPEIDKTIRDELSDELNKSFLVSFSTNNPDMYIRRTDSATVPRIEVISSTETLLYSKVLEAGQYQKTVSELLFVIKRFAQTHMLKCLELHNPDLLITFGMIKKTGNLDDKTRFQPGDAFKIFIKNNGDKPAYYNIIDIQPDNVINPVLPRLDINLTPEDCYIEPGDSIISDPGFTINKPYGSDMLFLIAAEAPLNLEFLTNTRGAVTKGAMNPFEILYKESFLQVRGKGSQQEIESDAVTIDKVVFEIVEKIQE